MVLQTGIFAGFQKVINALETVHILGVSPSAIDLEAERKPESRASAIQSGINLMQCIYQKPIPTPQVPFCLFFFFFFLAAVSSTFIWITPPQKKPPQRRKRYVNPQLPIFHQGYHGISPARQGGYPRWAKGYAPHPRKSACRRGLQALP